MTVSEAQDRFLSRRFGVFNHFLYGNPSDGANELNAHAALDWDKCVSKLDVQKLAAQLHEVNAGYYIITLMQGSRHMLAPNSTYDRIACTKPGEACPRRDLIGELAEALQKYDIDLFLYYTGDGPYLDPVIGPKFGLGNPRGKVTEQFVLNWASVLREYALRYGDRIKGWWIDGCYREFLGYTDNLMQIYYDACKAGNPAALVAMNDGIKPGFQKNFRDEDFVCGEFEDFEVLPPARLIDGAQAHILAPLGCGQAANPRNRWRTRGARLSKECLLDYVQRANAAGMAVSIDVFVDHSGAWDSDQMDVLKYLGAHI